MIKSSPQKMIYIQTFLIYVHVRNPTENETVNVLCQIQENN